MVVVVDEGSSHPVTVDKVWKLIQAHGTDGERIHPGSKNMKMEPINESQTFLSWDVDMGGGKWTHLRFKATLIPPLAQAIEVLEGPLAGSKFITTYVPKGNATVLNCVGDFRSPVMKKDEEVRKAAQDFLDRGFNEDGAYLRKMKL